jgi:hypothetical protein
MFRLVGFGNSGIQLQPLHFSKDSSSLPQTPKLIANAIRKKKIKEET